MKTRDDRRDRATPALSGLTLDQEKDIGTAAIRRVIRDSSVHVKALGVLLTTFDHGLAVEGFHLENCLV